MATLTLPTPPVDSPTVFTETASLYVGNLHPQVTEKELEDTFSTVAPLLSVQLIRSPFTNISTHSYAHINFSSASHASKALTSLNNLELHGVPMKIMRNQTHHLNEKSDAILFVKNLGPSVTSGALEGMFCKFGTILSCMVAEENGKSKGFGYVQFSSEDSAISAIKALHGTVFEGQTLCLSKFQSKTERKGDCMESQFTNLYVKNLPELFTEDSLREKFSKCGKVFNVAIMKDGDGKSKGFGFVNFESHEDAKKAIETLNGAPIGSKKLYVGKAQKKAEREELLKRAREEKKLTGGVNLYVKNLDISIDDSKLEEIFGAYGKVSSVKVMRNNNGVSKGFGFVSFSSEEVGMKALKSLHGRLVQGRFLYVGVAQRKEERVKELQTRFSTYNRGMFQQYYNMNYHVPFPPPNPLVLPNYLYPPTGFHPVYTCAPTRPPTQIPVRPSSQDQGLHSTGWVYQQKHPIRYVATSKQKRFWCKSVKVESKRISNEEAEVVPTRYQPVYACARTRLPTQIPVRSSLDQRLSTSGWVRQQKHPMRYVATSKQQRIWCKSVKVESKRISNGGAADAEPSSSEGGLGGQATKISELLLELEKSKIQKILDNPQYLAMQVMKATAQAKGASNPCARQAQAVHYPL